MNQIKARFIPIIALKLLKYITEIFFLVIAGMILSSMVISLVHTPSLIIFVCCLVWFMLSACTIYSVHSQKQEIGQLVKWSFFSILCGAIIFAMGWPNVFVFDINGVSKPRFIPSCILLIEAVSPIACYFFNVLLVRRNQMK